jgi:hypothetical protein
MGRQPRDELAVRLGRDVAFQVRGPDDAWHIMEHISMIGDALKLISQAVELASQIRGVADKAKDAETKLLIADLQIALATVKAEIADLMNENLLLKQQLEQRQTAPQPGTDIEFKEGAYWYRQPPAGRSPGPYCPRCKDVDGAMVTLSEPSAPFRRVFKWKCPQCDKTFN